jgi:hypothetical protein
MKLSVKLAKNASGISNFTTKQRLFLQVKRFHDVKNDEQTSNNLKDQLKHGSSQLETASVV